MKVKLFLTCEIQYFELGISSFNSYVYYLSRGFIASNRAFNLLTHSFNLPTRAFNLPTHRFELITREFELVTRGFELVTRGFELVTRNSCFTFQRELHIMTSHHLSKNCLRRITLSQYTIEILKF